MASRSKCLAALAAALALGALLALAAPASATFHLIKVREVFPGTVAHPDSDYVELQAYSPYQNQVQFGELHVYDASGSPASTFMPGPSPVANNANQMTVLIADTEFTAAFPGVTPDFTDAGLNLSPAAGAVCWPITEMPYDCVSWGAFTGNASLPSSAGTPFAGTGGSGAIADGKAISRSIAANCPSALDDADDTNDSAADFSESNPSPRPNSAAITESVCAPAGGGPVAPATRKKKCRKRKKSSGTGGGAPAYSAKKKKCKKKRK